MVNETPDADALDKCREFGRGCSILICQLSPAPRPARSAYSIGFRGFEKP